MLSATAMCEKTKRLAVVIGNSDYKYLTKLTNAVNDANAVKNTFRSLGFQTHGKNDLERNEILECFSDILECWKLEAKEIVIYYSGHGVSFDGKIYLAPLEARQTLSKSVAKQSFLDMDIIISTLLEYRTDDTHPIIIILDCCRSKFGPNDKRSNSQDLFQMAGSQKVNIAILYSTAESNVALDGYNKNEHSPYTKVLLENMTNDWTIDNIHSSIVKALGNSSEYRGKQVPYMYQSLHEPYRFSPLKPAYSFKLWFIWAYILMTFLILFSLGGLHYNKPVVLDPEIPSLPPAKLYGVPHRNNEFVDRPKIIAEITKILKEPSTEVNILALRGLGGMGKTQMMLHYCYLRREEYDFIFWVEADGWAAALDSFRELTVNLGLNKEIAKREYSDEKITSWVRNWLEGKTRWLLLLNNVDETTVTKIFKVLPRIGGDIILTTREYVSSKNAKIITIDKMNEDEALTLLLGTNAVDSIDHDSAEFRNAKKIITELDSMPLAIDVAHAHVEYMQISFKEYLKMFNDRRQRDILFSNYNNDNPDQYNHTLATVWQLSFEQVRTQNPLAGFILDVCTFLQPDTIPANFIGRQYSILKNASNLPPLSSDTDIRSAIALLVRFSFLARVKKNTNEEEDILTIHRLIQKAIFYTMSDEQKMLWSYALVTALNKETNFSDTYAPSTRTVMNTYLPHVRHFVAQLNGSNQDSLLSPDLQELLERTVEYLLDNGVLFGVETLAKLAVTTSESIYGVNDISTWNALSIYARYYQEKGRYADAEPLYRRTLAISENVLGPEDPITATSLNNLASLFIKLGNYADAELLFQRALTIGEKILGVEDLETAAFLNNLALLYMEQGNYIDAEPLCQRALAIIEKALGPEHPETAVSLNNLASLYEIQGNYMRAELLYKRALTIREETLGTQHPETAASMNNLALLYIEQGNYADAEPLCHRALGITEKILGPKHPDTAASLNNLALLHMEQGNYADTEQLFRRALEIREKALGSKHQDTSASLNNLALLYMGQGNYDDAKPLFQRALAIREKTLGPEHPDTAVALNNLASLHQGQGNYMDAKPLLQRALAINEKTLGFEHPSTAVFLNNLASLHMKQGNYMDAELLYQRSLVINMKTLGPEHPSTAVSLSNLVSLYVKKGNSVDTDSFYWTLGTEHPETTVYLNNLVSLYKNQSNCVDAKPLLQQALMIMEKTLEPEHPGIVSSLNSLAPLYMEQEIIPIAKSYFNGRWQSGRRYWALSIRIR